MESQFCFYEMPHCICKNFSGFFHNFKQIKANINISNFNNFKHLLRYVKYSPNKTTETLTPWALLPHLVYKQFTYVSCEIFHHLLKLVSWKRTLNWVVVQVAVLSRRRETDRKWKSRPTAARLWKTTILKVSPVDARWKPRRARKLGF